MCLQCARVEGFEPQNKKNGHNPTSVVLNSKNKQLGLWFFFPEFGLGTISENEFMFTVPKDSVKPYTWLHFCFNSDGKEYEVVVQGKQWYKGNHTNALGMYPVVCQ